jgi:peptide deformylase
MDLKNLQLVEFGNDMLKRQPAPFDFEKYNAEEVGKALMKKQLELNGAGLSANQVGLDMQVFTFGDGKDLVRYIINPEVVDLSDETVIMREGCLSLPGVWLNLKRPTSVTARYQRTDGSWATETFTELAARVFLHEYDHMLGQNFTQRASKLKLDMALKRIKTKVKNNGLRLQKANRLL